MKTPLAILAGLIIIAAAIYLRPAHDRYQYKMDDGWIAIMDRQNPRIIGWNGNTKQWMDIKPLESIELRQSQVWTPPATDPIIRHADE